MWLSSSVCVVGQHEKVYFLKSGNGGVLVDCGSEATYGANMKMLKADGIIPDMVDGILVSHEHFDHVGAIGRAREELGCPVISHRLAAGPVETGDPWLTASEMDYLGVHVPFLAAPVDEVVDEGDVIALGENEIEVYHIPGHTPGGAAYGVDGNLLVGDTVFLDGGIGWPDIHWGSCLDDHRDSIMKIAELQPETLLPGHGEAGRFHRVIVEQALEKIDFLEKAGVPSKSTAPAPRRAQGEDARRVKLEGLAMKGARRTAYPTLRSSTLFEFSSGDLGGHIRPRGKFHGLVLHASDGRPITRPDQCTLNLEHYCAAGTCAPFLPRTVCAKFHEVYRDRLIIDFSPTSGWPVHSRITYHPGGGSAVDVTFDFEFLRSFDDFEAFIASYFHAGKPAFVHSTGAWSRLEVEDDVQLFCAGSDSGAEQVMDGRWNWLEEVGLRVELSNLRYESAVLADWNEESGWALVQMVDPELCPSISTNTFACAQDLSLVGRDVERGERVRVRARVIYVKIQDPTEIEEMYGKYLRELEI